MEIKRSTPYRRNDLIFLAKVRDQERGDGEGQPAEDESHQNEEEHSSDFVKPIQLTALEAYRRRRRLLLQLHSSSTFISYLRPFQSSPKIFD